MMIYDLYLQFTNNIILFIEHFENDNFNMLFDNIYVKNY